MMISFVPFREWAILLSVEVVNKDLPTCEQAFPLKSTFITVSCSVQSLALVLSTNYSTKLRLLRNTIVFLTRRCPLSMSKRLHNGWSKYISSGIIPDISNSDNVTISAIPVLISHSIPSRLQILLLLSFWNQLLGIQVVFPPVSSYTAFSATA